MKQYITLAVTLDKPVSNIANLIAQRAYTIDGVKDVELVNSERSILTTSNPFIAAVSDTSGECLALVTPLGDAQPVADAGPWKVGQFGHSLALYSDQPLHDVALVINGTFSKSEDRRPYADALCAKMNTNSQVEAAPVDVAHLDAVDAELDATAAEDALDASLGPWNPIETAPWSKKLIVGYRNKLGNWRTVMACHYMPLTLRMGEDVDFDDDEESAYAPPGWYEEVESHETIVRTDEVPTHWMHLPGEPIAPGIALPAAAAQVGTALDPDSLDQGDAS